jgi:hypothetical protein
MTTITTVITEKLASEFTGENVNVGVFCQEKKVRISHL